MSFIVGLNTLVFVTIGMIVWFFHDFYITLPYVLATYYVIRKLNSIMHDRKLF